MITYKECEEQIGQKPEYPTPVKINTEDYERKVDAYLEYITAVYALWRSKLREEYASYNDEIFEAMYSESYDRYHSEGYDGVANGMIDLSDFVDKILASKGL
jgi:hypothetical protein